MQLHSTKLCFTLILCCLIAIDVKTSICQDPQKAFYMSYNAISKMDTIGNVFTHINNMTTKYNESYSDSETKAVYKVINLHPQFYYNQHHQIQYFLNSSSIQVGLGDIVYVCSFNYSIQENGHTKTGVARADVLAEQHTYFTKQIVIIDGYLQWNPIIISDIVFLSTMQIFQSNPPLTEQERHIMGLFIDDSTHPNAKIKERVSQQLNQLFKQNLKTHLNTEQIIGVNTINYKFGGVQVNFMNSIKNFTLSNDTVQGLQAFFHWQIQDSPQECTKQHFELTKYGGQQEWYAIASMKYALIVALGKGFADFKLNRNYQVQQFQFYMGDLTSSVSQALNYPADTPLNVSCKWNGDKNDVRLQAYQKHQLSASFNQICIVEALGKQIIEVTMDLLFVIRIQPLNDQLAFFISGASLQSSKFKALDPKFVVTDQNIARFQVARLVYGLAGRQTFGTGYKTSRRFFPAVDMSTDYMIIFDPSHRLSKSIQ